MLQSFSLKYFHQIVAAGLRQHRHEHVWSDADQSEGQKCLNDQWEGRIHSCSRWYTWKTVLTSFIFNSWYQIKYLDRPRQSYCPQCTFSKIVNKGLLCKSADKYGMQKMGPGHRSSLNNRHCILCDLTTHLQRHEESILLWLSLSNSSHTPRLPITPTLQHCVIPV